MRSLGNSLQTQDFGGQRRGLHWQINAKRKDQNYWCHSLVFKPLLESSVMAEIDKLKKLTAEFDEGISQDKCKKCGCMAGALSEMRDNLAASQDKDAHVLREKVNVWLEETEESLYT